MVLLDRSTSRLRLAPGKDPAKGRSWIHAAVRVALSIGGFIVAMPELDDLPRCVRQCPIEILPKVICPMAKGLIVLTPKLVVAGIKIAGNGLQHLIELFLRGCLTVVGTLDICRLGL